MIALGRVILCAVLLVAVAVDRSEPHLDWIRTYSLLIVYSAAALLIAVATWRSWWLDARLAIVTHGIDMAVFTAIVFSANGTTSPFFLFFVLPLLSAAIRWSWRETAITAATMVLLYIIAGLLIAGTGGFELERFIIRAGNLMILSLLLIWFGIHQRRTGLFLGVENFEAALGEQDNPLAKALDYSMRLSGANAGVLVIGAAGDEVSDGLAVVGGEARSFTVERPLVRRCLEPALLYDVRADRAVTREPEGRFRFVRSSEVFDLEEARAFGLGEGLLAEVSTGTQHGWMILWEVPDLSTDYIDLGRELGRAAGAILDRHALLTAIETGAAARTRLSLARDVHDSIVQFLAGAAFRIEAIRRSARAGGAIDSDLDELKRLFIEEQGELRGFVAALRRDRTVELGEVVAELRALAERLSHQWSIACRVTANGDTASIPIRLQLDLQQLVREAVANAVRHGGARHIDLAVAVEDGRLELSVADDGSGFPSGNGGGPIEPWSLKERVERASGSLRLQSRPGSTNILMSIPLTGVAA